MAALIRGSVVVSLSGIPGGFGIDARPSVERDPGFGYGWGWSMDMSDDRSVLIVGDIGDDQVQTWDWNGSAWVERASSPLNVGRFSNFGVGAAISGDGLVLAVGEPNWANGGTARGAVHIYDYNGGTGAWDLRNRIDGLVNFDAFGLCVHLSTTGDRVTFGTRYQPTSRLVAYDWNGAVWTEHVAARMTRPTSARLDVDGATDWAKAFRFTSDGTRVVHAFGGLGAISNNPETMVGVWSWNGAVYTRLGGDIFSPLGDGDQEQVIAVAISDDGLSVYVFWFGINFSWEGRIAVYDWVDPNWAYNSARSAAFDGDYNLATWADLYDYTGMWVSADESFVSVVTHLDYTGPPRVVFFGDVPGVETPCISKANSSSEVVIIGEYCLDIPPPYWDDGPLHIPRPPGGNLEFNPDCSIEGFYSAYPDWAQLLVSNPDYADWLLQNYWNIQFENGVCD